MRARRRFNQRVLFYGESFKRLLIVFEILTNHEWRDLNQKDALGVKENKNFNDSHLLLR